MCIFLFTNEGNFSYIVYCPFMFLQWIMTLYPLHLRPIISRSTSESDFKNLQINTEYWKQSGESAVTLWDGAWRPTSIFQGLSLQLLSATFMSFCSRPSIFGCSKTWISSHNLSISGSIWANVNLNNMKEVIWSSRTNSDFWVELALGWLPIFVPCMGRPHTHLGLPRTSLI